MFNLVHRRPRRHLLPAVAACALAAATLAVAAAASHSRAASVSVSIAYTSTQEFNSTQQAKDWFAMLKADFEKAHPGVTVKLIPIGGSYNDFVNKINLMLRSSSTTPDVIHEGTPAVAEQVAAKQLAPLDSYLKSWPDFKLFGPAVRQGGVAGPHVWQLVSGVVDFELYYNAKQFKRAGLPVPWHPKNWAQVLTAARKIKQDVPGVTPLWLYAGNKVWDQTTRENFLDLLAGTRSPVTKGGKWVVKSKGLLDTMNFYKTVFSTGLGPSQSDLANPAADGELSGTLMPKQQVAIALAGEWVGSWWLKNGPAPWAAGINTYKTTPLPTEFGQAPGYATQLQGSTFVMTSASKQKQLAAELMELAESKKFNLLHTEWTGEVPPRSDVGQDPVWQKSVPYYNAQAAGVLKYGTFTPAVNYTPFATCVGEATAGILAGSASANSAVGTLGSCASHAIGSSGVTTIP